MLADVPEPLAVAGRVSGHLFDLGDFPGLRPDPSSQAWVVGELHRPIDGSILEVLDRIEGFPGFDVPGGLFRRRILAVDTIDHRVERAWAYALAVNREYPNRNRRFAHQRLTLILGREVQVLQTRNRLRSHPITRRNVSAFAVSCVAELRRFDAGGQASAKELEAYFAR